MSGRWLNRHTLAWASYDVAGSTYFGIVPVVLFPVFFRSVVVPGQNGDLYWGFTIAAALLIAGISAPFIGMVADRREARWPLLVAATLVCCTATASCYFLGSGEVFAAAATFGIAHVGYLLATSLYESYLPHIVRPSDSGRISGFGWAIGFVGGIAAILAILPLARGGTDPPFLDRYRMSFVVVAAMFALLAAPALWGLRRVIDALRSGRSNRIPASIWSTVRSWRDQREVMKLLLASYLINDGMVTIAVFSANFFRVNFGASVERLLLLLLAYHVIALPATLAFGFLADRWTHRKAIALSLSIWIGALGLMVLGRGWWVPATVVFLLAVVLGSTQAMLRSLLARMTPIERSGEFFGLNTFAGRLSAALGPLLYGVVATVTGNERAALLSVLAFIVAGAGVLSRVRLPLRDRVRR
jgi:UMF1 family MFS transporter